MSARLALVGLALAALACGRPTYLPGPEVVGRLAEQELSASEFESYLVANLGHAGLGLASAALSGLFDQFVDEALLLRLARDRGVSTSDDAARAAVEALLAAGGPYAIADSEVRGYYQTHPLEFSRPERVRLWQLLAPDRTAAERARRQLEAGADFATLLGRAAEAKSGVTGGYQGELARDDLPPSYVEVVFKLAPGGVSPVVATDYGFHVFQVTAKLPAEVEPLARVEEGIRRRLERAQADARLAALVAEARSRYAVTVYDRNLPFEYSGRYPISRPYER